MALSRFVPVLFAISLVLGAASDAAAASATPRKTKEQRQEESLFKSLLNCPLCKGKEAVACFKRTRYEEGKTWKQALEECVENEFIRSTFLMMLPEEKADKKDDLDSAKVLEDISVGTQAAVGRSTEL
eukprot:gnl/TRDRNA2_/TRDRNA2_66532_c0_seq1.p2 gnl/TRDRNA2_/TRDRNA2_66532_c0~~gnl/TRDRNA2_/TRDRNA2_66532_c0_seq1.p2  ORF type:complete len:128 (+),score=35.80 gnl/TRDRNA2_/TRDRNA2_66532_c0_seq1:113-496(+)